MEKRAAERQSSAFELQCPPRSTRTSDLKRLDSLNDLSRYVCANRPDAEEIAARYRGIMAVQPRRKILLYLGAMLAAAAFAVFFGGSWPDAIAAAVLSVLIETLQLLPVRREISPVIRLFLVAFFMAVGGVILARLIPAVHLDKTLIGCIMLIIPGVSTTNAIRDLLSGDTTSGLARLADSLLQAGAIAGGAGLAIYFFGRGI